MKLYTYDCSRNEWGEFIRNMRAGDKCQVDRAIFDHFLGAIPPIFQNETILVQGVERRCDYGFAEGDELVVAFWREGKSPAQIFCQQTNYYPRELQQLLYGG